ncbi:MAG: NTP transferase domain-containing protein [Thaumarchaeota archaeon]|nr:NTP transferase domain-containing protein [Nitrososphaerota archaeon]
MKIIVIAAGSGKRLGEDTKDLPKYLIKVNGKTIMEHQIDVFKKIDYERFIVITGPHKEKFTLNNVTYVEDKNYPQHDILGSLMEAREYITGDVLISYSDIIFDHSILSKVMESKADIGIAIDLDWEKAYEGRIEHPRTEAENVSFDNNNILKIKKNISNQGKTGEFLGLMKLSAKGSDIFVKKFLEMEKSHVGHFQDAPSLQKAYLTDMIQELIDSKIDVKPIIVSGKWCEIDTRQDLERACRMFS